ncbi:MAG: M20 family metallo-hydrolase [Kiloniellales bacterium]|nr:M20 family metallo-hydrolase [Kiloniellales bacterium]
MAGISKTEANGTAARAAAEAVDQERLWRRLMTLAKIGATPRGGVNRQALTAEDAEARRLMVEWGEALGLTPLTDAIGNLYLRRDGSDPEAAPVMTGSHLDSQPLGGKFDGAYGVMAGLEALEAMNVAGTETRRPIELVAWTNEEGGRFQPGVMGSGVFAGEMALADLLPITDREGVSVGTALGAFLAATPAVPTRESGFPVAAYIEAHIEQGPLLEAVGKPIGVVESVQGLRWYAIEVRGEAAHAGTTPRRHRKDALKAAVAMVSALEEAMADDADTVRFTVGRFEVEPGSPNTVPNRVLFTIDFRHPDQATIDRLTDRIEPLCQANARGCAVTVTRTSNEPPTLFDPEVVATVERWRQALALDGMAMTSGAGHDAMVMARHCPSGMIFVPCEKGVSHNEVEAATPSDLAAGARVLTAALVDLASR